MALAFYAAACSALLGYVWLCSGPAKQCPPPLLSAFAGPLSFVHCSSIKGSLEDSSQANPRLQPQRGSFPRTQLFGAPQFRALTVLALSLLHPIRIQSLTMPWNDSDRVQKIVSHMKRLLGESRELAKKHDEIMKRYEQLKKELETLRNPTSEMQFKSDEIR